MTLQGLPTATTLSGMSFVTTLPAPITVFLPIVTPFKIFLENPEKVKLSIAFLEVPGTKLTLELMEYQEPATIEAKHLPIVTPFKIMLPPPIQQLSPIFTLSAYSKSFKRNE